MFHQRSRLKGGVLVNVRLSVLVVCVCVCMSVHLFLSILCIFGYMCVRMSFAITSYVYGLLHVCRFGVTGLA